MNEYDLDINVYNFEKWFSSVVLYKSYLRISTAGKLSELNTFNLRNNDTIFQGYHCKSGMAIFAWSVTWNYDCSPLKGPVKEKWKTETWESQELNDTYIYLIFLSREIDIKLCQTIPKRIYENILPYHVTRTPSNGSAVLLSRASVCITWPVYCTVIGGRSGHVISTYISQIYVLV